jgi:nucleoside-diphosphate-sugar epimerase
MKVLVIGGNGLIGRKTVLRLLQEDDITSVVSMDVIPPKDWIMKRYCEYGDKFVYHRGSVAELEEIMDAVRKYSIDRLVNLAFILPGDVESDPRMSVRVNLLGMCNAFEAARLAGISRVVYASSEGVYGPQDDYGDRDVTEDDRLRPGSAYALGKQISEVMAEQYTTKYRIAFSAVRPATCFGHGGRIPREIRLFSELVSLPAVGKPFSVDDDGTAPYSLFTPDDIGEFTVRLLKVDSSPHPVYNIGSRPYCLRDVAEVVRKFLPDAVIEFGNVPPPPDRGQMGIPWRINSHRAYQDFGYRLKPLEESVLLQINDARLEAGMSSIQV